MQIAFANKMERANVMSTDTSSTPHNTMKDHPNNRLADALAVFFRSLSGSSDRELAGAAFKLEDKVLDLVRNDAPKPPSPKRPSPPRQ